MEPALEAFGEVARRVEPPETQRAAGGRLRQNRRNHRARRLPRTVRVEWPDDRQRQPERPMEAQPERVGGDLRRGIRRLRLQRMIFVHRDALRGPVHLARRRQDEALERVQLLRREQHVRRADDVCVDHFLRMLIRVRDADQCSEMKHSIGAARDLAHSIEVAHVPEHDLDARQCFRRQCIETAALAA